MKLKCLKIIIAINFTALLIGCGENMNKPTEKVEIVQEERRDTLGLMGPGKLLPYPNCGKVVEASEYSNICFYDIVGIKIGDFEDYAVAVVDAGFSENIVKYDGYFYGETADGQTVMLSYHEETETEKERYSVTVANESEGE